MDISSNYPEYLTSLSDAAVICNVLLKRNMLHFATVSNFIVGVKSNQHSVWTNEILPEVLCQEFVPINFDFSSKECNK